MEKSAISLAKNANEVEQIHPRATFSYYIWSTSTKPKTGPKKLKSGNQNYLKQKL